MGRFEVGIYGANFNLAYGQNHDPVIACMAGAARTMTAYLISCHFSENGGAGAGLIT